jgi:hypothetical protein
MPYSLLTAVYDQLPDASIGQNCVCTDVNTPHLVYKYLCAYVVVKLRVFTCKEIRFLGSSLATPGS